LTSPASKLSLLVKKVLSIENARRAEQNSIKGNSMKVDSVTVELRLSVKPDSKVKAFADVTIPLGDDGTVTVLGFSVLDGDGRPARLMAPARKGQKTWFDTVQLTGRIRQLVDAAVLQEYERMTAELQ
jgi:DNA-binding cell septation regulator SpoVG